MSVVLTDRDVVFLAAALGTIAALSVAAWLTRRRWSSLLTGREWRIVCKILAILALWFLLVATSVATDVPGELLIYGRF